MNDKVNMPSPPAKLSDHRKAMLELDYQIRASRPIIYICTHEERRVMTAFKALGERDNKNWTLLSWDIADGLKAETDYQIPDGYMNQLKTLDWFRHVDAYKEEGYQILIAKDFQKLMGDDGNQGQTEKQVIRLLRNMAGEFMDQRKVVIIIGTKLFLPPELEKVAAVIDWPLPEHVDIEEKVNKMILDAKALPKMKTKFKLDYKSDEFYDIVQAFRGLSLDEVELLTTYMMLTEKGLESGKISSKKRDIIRKAGIVDWIEIKDDMNSVGGLNELKAWLVSRKQVFTPEAKVYGLPDLKGVLLLGVQGAGKSLSVKSIGGTFELPVLRLDMGKVFSGLVGSSEENIRSAIKVAESVSPCILWIDEIDKGFSGSASSNASDGGTTSRVLGTFLTWMQEKTAPVFVVATANDVSNLPPELLRKGRFDEIFFVDLPSEEDRKEILSIHLSKRGRDPSLFELKQLAMRSKSLTGAEIEAAIVSGMFNAFSDGGRELNSADIEKAIKEMVPLAVTMKEKIEDLRAWAEVRARNASTPTKSSNDTRQEKVRGEINNLMANIDFEEEL